MNITSSSTTNTVVMRIQDLKGESSSNVRLQQSDNNSIANSVIAGYVAGVCGVTIGHPMDSLKVFLQTGTPIAPTTNAAAKVLQTATASSVITTSSMPHSVSAAAATPSHQVAHITTVATATRPAPRAINIRTLYAGVGGSLFTVGLLQSANFCIYDSLRRFLYKRDVPSSGGMDYMNHDSITNVAIASMTAGSILSFITSPLLVIKTKQQVMTWDFKTALKDTMRKSVGSSSKGVISNFFVGFGPHFVSESVGRGVYFAAYESIKREMAANNGKNNSGESKVTLPQRMAAAGMSGILCWSVIFPLDVLRNRLCAKAITHVDAGNAWTMAKSMYQQGKLRPFYRGFSVTVLRAGPVAAAVLPVYDATLEWLN